MLAFLFKLVTWLVVYPIGLVGYIVTDIIELISFMFNSPVDIWNIISRAVDGVEEEPAQE